MVDEFFVKSDHVFSFLEDGVVGSFVVRLFLIIGLGDLVSRAQLQSLIHFSRILLSQLQLDTTSGFFAVGLSKLANYALIPAFEPLSQPLRIFNHTHKLDMPH